jgi:hypothetical protein
VLHCATKLHNFWPNKASIYRIKKSPEAEIFLFYSLPIR